MRNRTGATWTTRTARSSRVRAVPQQGGVAEDNRTRNGSAVVDEAAAGSIDRVLSARVLRELFDLAGVLALIVGTWIVT